MQGSKEMWRLVSCSLFLLLLCGLDALTCRDKFLYSGFRGRSKIPPLVSSTAASKALCAIACEQLAACKSFSFRSGTEGCSLFPRRIMALDVDPSIPSEEAHFSRVFASCPVEKGYFTVPETTKCIRVEYVSKTWVDAAEACAEDCGHLLIIENADVMQKLMDFLPGGAYHVGFNDVDTEDQHLWLDRTPVNRTLFHSTEPSDERHTSVEDCGLLATYMGGLYDLNCKSIYKSLCSLPMEG